MASLNHNHLAYAILFSFFLVVGLLRVESSVAQSVTGTTGLFSIPTARVMPDKTVSAGFYFFPGALSNYSRDGLYDNGNFHATLTFLPRLEVMFRYTGMLGETKSARKIRFMDRMIAARIQLTDESRFLPAVLLGFQDFGGTFGASANNYFGANYVVITKEIPLPSFLTDFSTGYAYDLKKDPSIALHGLFAGAEFRHTQISYVSLILEYDSERINAATKIDFGFLQCMSGLMGMKYFSGGCSARLIL